MTEQLYLLTIQDASREAAKSLIRSYVKRGDSIQYLRDMGSSSPDSYSVNIGCYSNNKKYSNDKIVVTRDMNGKVVNQVYSKKEIYDELKNE